MNISVLIPAHNEEKMIAECVESSLRQTRLPDQIVVINDGSTDATAGILASYGDRIHVVTTETPTGNKSRAQEFGLKYVTGDIVITTDGDTILHPRFVELIEQDFLQDPGLSVVAGYVESMRQNVLTSLREIDYTLGQDLYKRAQASVNFILVIPGCAGAFKTHLFRDGTICFDHDTLTEDLDFTYKLNTTDHRIKFNSKAIAYTQDPPTVRSYVNQMRRWYGGGWQNLKKHLPRVVKNPRATLILSLGYLEGFFFSLVLFILPFIDLTLFVHIISLYLVVNILVGLYAAMRKRRIGLLIASPFLVVYSFLNAYVFLERFVTEIILRRTNMVWFQPERIHTTVVMKKNQDSTLLEVPLMNELGERSYTVSNTEV